MNINKKIKDIRKLEDIYTNYTHEQILSEMSKLKSKSQKIDKILPNVFALTSIASSRTLGLVPYDVQLMGAIYLHKGMITEQKTGEGKSLVAAFPAILNALSGKGVHVITVNDYLAKRDSIQIGKIYRYLGLTIGCIYSGMPFNERKEAYQCDITYGTNSEFGFDYLRDNIAKTKEQIIQRDLNYAIIDEVDSVLIDDSRTPLIISGGTKDTTDMLTSVDKVVKSLKRTTNYNPDATVLEKSIYENEQPNGDYIVIPKSKEVYLTDCGVIKIEKMMSINLSDESSLIQHYVMQSLKANYTMEKDVDYIVKDNKIIIIDGSTGRLMESRKFSDNLHQAIEAKEGIPISEENRTLATVSYQNFFRLYKKICGMTGTAYTDKYEFKTIYGLKTIQIPTNKPVIRVDAPDMLFSTKKEKYEALLNKIQELHTKGQPLLIGTPSIEESEIIANLLYNRGYEFNVLNAKNHEKEAEIIAQAGQYKAITIATNMAGRGTDILLGGNPYYEIKDLELSYSAEELTASEYEEKRKKIILNYEENKRKVIKTGGLAVLGVERFDNRRIDNQLRGRSGRQGDPGYSQFFLSLEDKIFKNFGNSLQNKSLDFSYTSEINTKFIRNTQKLIENFNYSIRKNTLDYDDVNDLQRKQIYQIRKQILLASDVEIMDLFEKYRNEIIFYLANCNEDLKHFFHTNKDINRNIETLNKEIQFSLDVNERNLLTHNNTIANMIRYVILNTIDNNWINYINMIITLKETVNITVMGTLKPIQLYKIESIKLFNQLIFDIKLEIIRSVYLMKIIPKLDISISM